MKIQEHQISLRGRWVVLRPMTEQDWDVLLRWNSDPEVLYYAEGDDVCSHTLEQVQAIYRSVSQRALCFIIEVEGTPIGECWLQEMNLERVLQRYPGMDCRRIDLMIGEKPLWGQGYGTETIQLLTVYALDEEGADAVFGCDIWEYNLASLRAFEKAGYRLDAEIVLPPGRKAERCYDLVIKNKNQKEGGTCP